MRGVTWNAWVGQSADELIENAGELLRDTGFPVVLATQETWRLRRPIPGYKRFAADGGHPENASCQLHVRRGVKVLNDFFLRPGGPNWVGPKHGLVHPPRVFPGVTLVHAKQLWDVVCLHRVPGGPDALPMRNREAWRHEDERLQAFADHRARRRPERNLLLLGDWNNGAGDRSPLSVRDLAKRIDAEMALEEVDGALVRGHEGKVRTRKLSGRYGSDNHEPVVVSV